MLKPRKGFCLTNGYPTFQVIVPASQEFADGAPKVEGKFVRKTKPRTKVPTWQRGPLKAQRKTQTWTFPTSRQREVMVLIDRVFATDYLAQFDRWMDEKAFNLLVCSDN